MIWIIKKLRKKTEEFKNDAVVITIEDVEYAEMSKNLNLDKSSLIGGGVYMTEDTSHTFTKKTK